MKSIVDSGIFSLVAVIVLFVLVYFYLKNRRFLTLIFQIPYPAYIPAIGALLLFVRHKFNFIKAFGLSRKTDIFCVYGGRWMVFISKPEDMEVLCNNPDNQERGLPLADGFREVTGTDNILIATMERAKQKRKTIQKAFNMASQKIFFENFHKANLEMLKSLESEEGKLIKIVPFTRTATATAICRSALSLNLGDFPFYQDILQNSLDKYNFAAMFKGTIKNDFLFDTFFRGKELMNILAEGERQGFEFIEEKRKEISELEREGKEVPNQYIYNIIRENPAESSKERHYDILALLGAGLDTSALTAAFAFLLMAMNPDVQQRVYEEDRGIQKELDGGMLDESVVPKYQYLSRVIKETMRIFPSLPIMPRLVKKEVKFGKFTIPEGVTVMGSILSLHRDPSIYKDPLKFDPDRFLPENMAKLPKYAYLPFGAGPRGCPGYKYGINSIIGLISTIIRKYEVFTTYVTVEEIDNNLNSITSLFDMEGFPIRLVRR